MSLNTINTNNTAIIALQSLNATNAQLASTEKRISTGYRVADATDDGAAYAVAQGVRSDVASLTSANEQLGNAKGLLATTISGLNDISNTLIAARTVLLKLSDSTIQGNERTQYTAQYQSLIANVKSFIQDASYSGKTLIGNLSHSTGTFGGIGVVRNEVGASYSVGSFSGSALYAAVILTGTQLGAATTVGLQISTTGGFTAEFNTLGGQLSTYGASSKYIDNQVSYNNDKVDALNSGLGALIDADLTKESARLQSLQTRQQLGTQALSIANQASQSLLSLFK